MGDAELLERILHLAAGDVIDERPDGRDEDAHFSQALAHTVISSYFLPGETLLDPVRRLGHDAGRSPQARPPALSVSVSN